MEMPAPLRLRLDQRTREAVAEQYEQARSAVERTNCQVVLLADEGRSITEIGWLVRRGREQVRTILHRFQSEGVAGLLPRPRTGRPPEVTSAWLAELRRGIEGDPHTGGVGSAVGATRRLADYLGRGAGPATGNEARRGDLHHLGDGGQRPPPR